MRARERKDERRRKKKKQEKEEDEERSFFNLRDLESTSTDKERIDTWVKLFAVHTDWLELDSRLASSHIVPKLRLQCRSITHSSGRAQRSVHTELIWNDQGMLIVELFFFEQQLNIDSSTGIYNLGSVSVINEAVAGLVRC
ncbi:hypothetical protein OROMI_012854 [Orobanche minor]